MFCANGQKEATSAIADVARYVPQRWKWPRTRLSAIARTWRRFLAPGQFLKASQFRPADNSQQSGRAFPRNQSLNLAARTRLVKLRASAEERCDPFHAFVNSGARLGNVQRRSQTLLTCRFATPFVFCGVPGVICSAEVIHAA